MESFNRAKWHHYFIMMLKEPTLIQFDKINDWEKRIYEMGGLRTIIIRYPEGEKILIFDEKRLQFEGDYDEIDNRIYVTSETMLKPLFDHMQLKLLDFIEEFAEKDRKKEHDRYIENQIRDEIKELLLSKNEEIKKEAEELQELFEEIKNRKMEYAVEMKNALLHLRKKQKRIKNVRKVYMDEDKNIYDI